MWLIELEAMKWAYRLTAGVNQSIGCLAYARRSLS